MQDERCTWQDDLAILTDAKFATEPHGSLSICAKQPYEICSTTRFSGDNLALKLGSDGLRVRRFIANYRQETKVRSRWIRMESGRNPPAAWGAMWSLHFRSIRLTPPS